MNKFSIFLIGQRVRGPQEQTIHNGKVTKENMLKNKFSKIAILYKSLTRHVFLEKKLKAFLTWSKFIKSPFRRNSLCILSKLHLQFIQHSSYIQATIIKIMGYKNMDLPREFLENAWS